MELNREHEQNEKLLNELEGAPLMPSEDEVLYNEILKKLDAIEDGAKKLIKENENLHASCTELTRKLKCANLEIECKERILESYMLQYGTVADKEVWLKKERADTVRKMQERLKAEKFTHKNFGELVYVEDIDQIAEEIIGETK